MCHVCSFSCVFLSLVKFIFTRHYLVRAKGEVFVLLYVVLFVFLFGQRFLDNPRADGPIHAKVCMLAYSSSGCVFSPFGG